MLSRDLAARNHYPAIDVLQSVSRTMPDVTDAEHRAARPAQVREWLATLRDSEDLVSVGAYVPGSNPRIDAALARRDAIDAFLCQPADTAGRLADALDGARTRSEPWRRFRFRAAAALDLRRKQEERRRGPALARRRPRFARRATRVGDGRSRAPRRADRRSYRAAQRDGTDAGDARLAPELD